MSDMPVLKPLGVLEHLVIPPTWLECTDENCFSELCAPWQAHAALERPVWRLRPSALGAGAVRCFHLAIARGVLR